MIKKLPNKDIERAIALVNKVFSEFVAIDYSEEGRNTFALYLKTKLQEISDDVKNGHKKMWAYYQDNEIVGVIAMQNISHISLLFVDKEQQRKGIARQLFLTALNEVKQSENPTKITVNSSPYAVEAYEHLGFIKTNDAQETNGIIYIPMEYVI